jgi:hypothetical protein
MIVDTNAGHDLGTALPEILAMVIPIVAIVLGIGIAALGMFLDFRKKREFFQLHHAERMAAIEKGIELPPLPPEFFQSQRRWQRTPADQLRRGLVFLLVGAAVTAALYYQPESHRQALWGLVLVAVGLANLLSYAVAGRQPADAEPTDASNSRHPR